MSNSFSKALLLAVFTLSITVLALSFLAPVTETLKLSISTAIYSALRTFCHQMPSRSLWYANSHFGVCSHCFGIFLGVALMSAFLSSCWVSRYLFEFAAKHPVILLVISLVPFGTDILVGAGGPSVNPQWVRVAAAFMASAGIFIFLCFWIARVKKSFQVFFLKTVKEV